MKSFKAIAIGAIVFGVVSCKDSSKNKVEASTDHSQSHQSSRQREIWGKRPQSRGLTKIEGLTGTLGELAASDIEAAYKHAQGLQGQEARDAIAKLLMAAVVEQPDFVARRVLDADISNADREKIEAALMRTWPDVELALDWAAKNVEGSNKGKLIGGALIRLLSKSPNAAFNFLESMEPSQAKTEASTMTYSSWASSDPIGALEASSQMEDKNSQKFVKSVAFSSLAFQQPQKALEYLEEQLRAGADARSKETASDLSNLASSIASARLSNRDSPSEIFIWTLSLPTDIKQNAQVAALSGWSERDPNGAAAALQKVDEEQRAKIAVPFVDKWASRDPAKAAAWLATYPQTPESVIMTESVVARWAGSEPHAAYEWLDTLPAGKSRDAGVLKLIIRERPTDPDTAFLWAETISDPVIRNRELDTLMKNYNLGQGKDGRHK